MSSKDASAAAEVREPRVVWGIEAIGQTIGRSPSAVRWLIQTGRLRVRRHGRRTFSAIADELIEDVSGEYRVPDETEN